MRTSNPALNSKTFANKIINGEVMTLNGAVNKTFILIILAFASAFYIWNLFQTKGVEALSPWIAIGFISGIILSLITIFKKEWAPVTAPLYAIAEGLVLGSISSIFEMQFPGIVIQAVALTFGTLFCMLLAYKTHLIEVTQNFRLGVIAATGAIALFYFITIILSFFGINIGFIHQSGAFGIGLSLFIVFIAALNLVLDFDFIEQGAASKQIPKYMEWYAGFGLLVTLVWLYLEILRLLTKIRSRN